MKIAGTPPPGTFSNQVSQTEPQRAIRMTRRILASRWDITLPALEIAMERFTFVMLTPLWLILAKCADDAWTIWKRGRASEVAPVSASASTNRARPVWGTIIAR